jgi:hypothetical protein
MGLALIAVVTLSQVEIEVWFFQGIFAEALTLVYAGFCLFWAVFPHACRGLHPYMAVLAILISAGRIGGFVELAIDRGEWSLTGAVMERTFMGLCLLQLHIRSAHGR